MDDLVVDDRVRVPLDGAIVDLELLDAETGGYGLCGSDTEVVAVAGSPVTEKQLRAALATHTPRSALGNVPAPLDAEGVTATLNAVLEVWTLTDAARAVHLPEQALVDEANAWAYAAAMK